MTLRLVTIAALALLLAGCGTPTPYVPARDGGYGYAVQQLEANRFRVSFSGNALTDRDTVENYLLYRAAEVTLAHGKDYFTVVNRNMNADTTYHTTYDTWPYFGPYRYWDPYWPGFGYPSSGTSTADTRYRAYAEIVLHAGRKPADDPRAFDAREVIHNLGPVIRRRPPDAN